MVPAGKVDEEFENPGSQERIIVGRCPFMWAQSLYILGKLLQDVSIIVAYQSYLTVHVVEMEIKNFCIVVCNTEELGCVICINGLGSSNYSENMLKFFQNFLKNSHSCRILQKFIQGFIKTHFLNFL